MVTIGHQTYLHFNTVYIFMIYFTVWSMKWLWLNHVWEAYVSLLWNLNLALNHVGKQNIQCIICQHVPNWSSMTENRESSFFELQYFRDDRIPLPSSQEWIFTQTLTAAPSGPQESGTVIQTSDRTPRSTHWFIDESVATALSILKKMKTILDWIENSEFLQISHRGEILHKITLFLSVIKHINSPLPLIYDLKPRFIFL